MNNTTGTLELIDEENDTLKIEVQPIDQIPGCLSFQLRGEINTYNSFYFQRQVLRAIEAGFVRLSFDCTKVRHIASTGIGALVLILREARTRGGDIVLSALAQRVYEVFELLGFASFFNFADTKEDSLRLLDDQSKEGKSGPFPRIFSCPICRKKLKAPGEGRFRCSECKTILKVDRAGQVTIG